MGGFFGMLATLFGKLGTFTSYVAERVLSTYEGLVMEQKIAVYVVLIILILMAIYVITLIFRFHFKISTRKLKNVRREYQITINRKQGKRCNFVWDILLYQKMVIIDDPLLPLEDNQKLLKA